MLNLVVLQGRLTADPVIKETQDGKKLATFSLAVQRDGNGQNVMTDYVDMTAWDKTAGIVEQYLIRGTEVTVVGQIRQSKWRGDDGQTRSRIQVTVNKVYFRRQQASNSFADEGGVEIPGMGRFTPLDDDDEIPLEF